MSHDDDYFICSHCGAELPLDARVCTYCGASDESGWGDLNDDDYGDDFDYDDYLRREFPEYAEPLPRRVRPIRLFNTAVAAIVILAMLWLMFGWTCR